MNYSKIKLKNKSGTESGQKKDKNRSNDCREGVLENGGCDTRNIRVSEKAARCHNERIRVLSILKCHGTPDLRHLKKENKKGATFTPQGIF
ncbi:hypothetical protein [Nostoc sp. WHI]|uniref:hypothetical protein n=1 Tax=Nostoc sp. WHI TaxID=2650611 RepID=UPI0018C5C10D|nr:hypothetical protein [Nostoc sp. WHI]MBG1266978.1 hypothetical protein [Nostoc sp. WHI]